MKDPKQVAEKWNKNIKSSQDSIRAGVANVKEAPGVLAAKAQDKMLQNLMEAINSGKWAKNVAAVSKEEWQAKMEIGIQRISAGADAALPKMEKFMNEFLPYVEQGAEKVRAMPNLTLDDSINRAAEMIRHNANFKKS